MAAADLTLQAVCQETAETNHAVAAANAAIARSLQGAAGELVDEGRAQRELALRVLEDVEQRRREYMLEAWAYKGLFALVAIATIL